LKQSGQAGPAAARYFAEPAPMEHSP
jgi:hypothetical protein